ncbi:MAG TPA: winged helix-turn-helix domain-containing protein [Nitrososphaeraceae archaeon]|nr:winged helix-turn-helix domain-containing protein [Nitrososphaeraceae archaeon]
MKQEKRHKLQLYYAILCAIEEDVTVNRIARPTRVQHFSRLSYDKMMNRLIELEQKEMIYRTSDGLVSITSKGRKFIRQYDELINLVESVGL